LWLERDLLLQCLACSPSRDCAFVPSCSEAESAAATATTRAKATARAAATITTAITITATATSNSNSNNSINSNSNSHSKQQQQQQQQQATTTATTTATAVTTTTTAMPDCSSAARDVESPAVPQCLPAPRWSNSKVPPQCWGMSVAQFSEFLCSCRETHIWAAAKESKGYVNLYDIDAGLVKLWTRNTGSGVALRMNPQKPLPAELMVSHCWGEDLDQCEEALLDFCGRHALPLTRAVWFCAFAQYQPGDEPGDVGPTIAEQLQLDPFGSVIKSTKSGSGMVVVHTSCAKVYDR
ncbi:unnamed protein product, partial [Polarella glacialis]